MKISKSLVGLSLALAVLFPVINASPALANEWDMKTEQQKMEMQKLTNWNRAHVTWMTTPDAAYYNVYYKMVGATMWQHAVRRLPKTSNAVDIKYLMKGKKYVYVVSAVKPNGMEFWWSKEMTMKTMMMK